MVPPYQIGVYYFPNYHVDPRNETAHGTGWTEWELVKRGEPRFPGHQQPKVPLWGYENEADPTVFARKIDAAADHAISHFIFDWYWYEDGPFLGRGLEEGYLRATNRDRLGFTLMWANHDWVDIHPAKMGNTPKLLYPGAVSPAAFDGMTDYIIEHYFSQPSYWKIDGCPTFSIYELYRLIDGIGGIENARAGLRRFREKTKAAGFPDLHLNAVVWGVKILPTEKTVDNPNAMLALLGFNSVTTYVWVHHVWFSSFPETPYREMADAAARHWEKTACEFDVPYFPNVTMGWDSSPRTVQSNTFGNYGYPFTPILAGNTPAAFRDSLRLARAYLDTHPASRHTLTINAWNEWTEGSYLEPDLVNGMGYLEAINEVFG